MQSPTSAQQRVAYLQRPAAADVQARREQALAAGGIATWVLDLPGGRVYLDAQAVRLLSTEVDEDGAVTIESFVELLHEQDRMALTRALEAALLAADGLFECECRITPPGGVVRWVIARGRVERDADERPSSLSGVIIDITERKLSERRLQVAEHQHRTLVDRLPVACYTMDSDGRLTYFNQAAARLWGREPILGEDLWCGSYRMATLDGRPLALDACPAAVALNERRTVRGVEAYVIRPDGSRRWVIPHPDPIYDEDGTFIGVVNVLIDVSDEREGLRSRTRK